MIHRIIPTTSQNHMDRELNKHFNMERSNNFAQKLARGYKIAIFQHPPPVQIKHYTPLNHCVKQDDNVCKRIC